MSMRIAYLMVCHKNPAQVNREIRALNISNPDAQTDFYLHVDKKSPIALEIMTADNVFMVEDAKRVSVTWGGVDLVDAILVLMRMAIASNKEYDYLWLVSCQDYPIKPEKEMISFLEGNRGKNFINCMSCEGDLYRRFLKRNMIPYPRWIMAPGIVMRVLQRLYIEATGGRFYTFPFLRKRPPFTGAEKGMFYFGATWFAVTLDCAKYLLDFVGRRPDYRRFFKNACIPDECFFQTIICNSPFRHSTAEYLCYVDWSGNKRNPSLLTARDYDKLVRSPYLIARKFDDTFDSGILDKLDALKHQ
jgi:hypothetical protein